MKHSMMTPAHARRVLEVDTVAAWEDVRQSYLDLVRVWHPDRFETDPRLRAKAERRLADINAAFRVLDRPRALPVTPLPAAAVRSVAVVAPAAQASWVGRISLVLAMVTVSGLIMAPRFAPTRRSAAAIPAAPASAPVPQRPMVEDATRRPRPPAVVRATPRSFIDRETDALLTGSDRTSP